MKALKTVIDCILIPLKIIVELIDPILRYIEMFLNIVFGYIFGWIVDLFALLPSIGIISLGECILSIVTGVLAFLCYDKLFFFISSNSVFIRVLICLLIAIVSYFVLYFVIKVLLNLLTSLVSLIIVLVRLAIYLPASGLIIAIKAFVSVGLSFFLWFINEEYWMTHCVVFLVCICAAFLIVSIVILICRRDVKITSLGILGNVKLSDLKAFNHSIGIYMMTLGVLPVYIGRAIEFNNGGLRKRLRDYIRNGNSARKHTSGRLINQHKDELKLYIIELGHVEKDVEKVKEAENSMIGNIFTAFNVVNSTVNYIVNILGYIIGGGLSCYFVLVYVNILWLKIALSVYSIIVAITCICMYCIENSKKD